MEAIKVTFYMNLSKEKRKGDTYFETVQLLIDYIRIITKIHRGTFDLFHMDGYGSDGLDKIELAFREFSDLKSFMDEKHVKRIENISLTSDDILCKHHKLNTEAPE